MTTPVEANIAAVSMPPNGLPVGPPAVPEESKVTAAESTAIPDSARVPVSSVEVSVSSKAVSTDESLLSDVPSAVSVPTTPALSTDRPVSSPKLGAVSPPSEPDVSSTILPESSPRMPPVWDSPNEVSITSFNPLSMPLSVRVWPLSATASRPVCANTSSARACECCVIASHKTTLNPPCTIATFLHLRLHDSQKGARTLETDRIQIRNSGLIKLLQGTTASMPTLASRETNTRTTRLSDKNARHPPVVTYPSDACQAHAQRRHPRRAAGSDGENSEYRNYGLKPPRTPTLTHRR